MNNIKNNTQFVKDNSKGQKIVAATYLVSEHMSDNDPLKNALRSTVLGIFSSSVRDVTTCATRLADLLQSAVLAGLISEKNASIIAFEANKFSLLIVEDSMLENDVFKTRESFEKKDNANKLSRFPVHTPQSYLKGQSLNSLMAASSINKTNRGDAILSFMNSKKSATIKDIVGLFPNVSEKTIQRELGALVSSGKLVKRGSKRWSVYLLATS